MKETVYFASRSGAKLDSSVYSGGGTDDTIALQALLDKALEHGRAHIILDGAARITTSLRIHSNTTLECPDKSCGIFLSDRANRCILRNADWDMKEIRNENITLLGGTYHQNAPGQVHHVSDEEARDAHLCSAWVMGMEFYGVRHFLARDVTIRNQRTFAALFANWEHVQMQNIHIDLPAHQDYQNQDGLHFWGPGRFLTLRDIRGRSGDDFIALAPDENDLVSDITDVLIDGVQLDGADQGIRLLSRGEGLLDRVIIRNVTGTYKSYGFFINPWFEGSGGHYGNIVLDTVDLRALKNNYDYQPPLLFSLGGNIESMTLRNIYHHRPRDNRRLICVGGSYNLNAPESEDQPTHVDRLVLDGIYVDEQDEASIQEAYVRVRSRVEQLVVRNVCLRRAAGLPKRGALVRTEMGGTVGELILENITAHGLETLVDAKDADIGTITCRNGD